jgi:hypothetical protein
MAKPRTVTMVLVHGAFAIMSLPRPLRGKAAALINAIDAYNSIVETVGTGAKSTQCEIAG